MKTEEKLNALKEEVDALNTKLAVLTEEELTQVCGGAVICTDDCENCKKTNCRLRKG